MSTHILDFPTEIHHLFYDSNYQEMITSRAVCSQWKKSIDLKIYDILLRIIDDPHATPKQKLGFIKISHLYTDYHDKLILHKKKILPHVFSELAPEVIKTLLGVSEAFSESVYNKSPELVEYFVKEPEIKRGDFSYFLLNFAVMSCDTKILTSILFNTQFEVARDDCALLKQACTFGTKEAVEVLTKDPRVYPTSSILREASYRGCCNMVNCILAIEKADMPLDRSTAIKAATEKKHTNIIQILNSR